MRRAWLPVALATASVAALTLAGFGAFRRFPNQSPVAWLQFGSFYILTVLYPMVWKVQHARVLTRRGLGGDRELRAFAWAPVVVGGTGFLIALTLLAGARG